MGSKSHDSAELALSQLQQMLAFVHDGSTEKGLAAHVYSYSNGFRGFAEKISEPPAEIVEMDGVVSVFPNRKRSLHTTRSWDFMGLAMDETVEIRGFSTQKQDNVIIGFIDTGELDNCGFILMCVGIQL